MIHLGLAIAFALLCLLAVVKAPIGFLWKPRVFVTEWGHLFVIALLLFLIGGWQTTLNKVALGLAAFGTLLALTPMLRARSIAGELPKQLEAAFGPGLKPAEPALSSPLSLKLSLSADGVSTKTLTYNEKLGLKLDLYTREGRQKRPIIVQIHGGSWKHGERTQLPGINNYLAARGFAVAAITYRLSPEHRFPAALEDCLSAAEFLRAKADELGLDKDSLYFMGRSAGGHLSLLAGYRAGKLPVRGIIAYYPPTDLNWSWQNPANPLVIDSHGTLGDFLGGDPKAQPENYHQSSPINFITPKSPPTLLLHGAGDELVKITQSERLAAVLKQNGVPHYALLLPWATHGFDANLAGPGGQLSTYAIERFLAFTEARPKSAR